VLETTRYLDAPLIALAEHATLERFGDVLEFAARRWYPVPDFFRRAARRLISEQLPAALRLCQAGRHDGDKAAAFAAIAPLLDAAQARRFLAPVHTRILDRPLIFEELGLHLEEPRLVVVTALLDRLPELEARAAASEHIDCASRSRNNRLELPLLARYLPGDLRRTALTFVYEGLGWPGDAPEKFASFLPRFWPLRDDEVAEAFDRAQANSWSEARLKVADVLAPHLPDRLLLDALGRVTAFPLEEECFAALAQLGLSQADGTRDQTAVRGLAMAAGIGQARYKARAVAALAPILLRPELADAAFAILWSVDPFWGVRAMEAMADVLPIERLREVPGRIRGWISPDPALDIPRILERLAAAGYAPVIDSLLPGQEGAWQPSGWQEIIPRLAPVLSPPQARRLWEIWDRENSGHYDAEALSALVGRLPENERARAVDEVLAACTPISGRDCERVLGRLARAASTERLTEALRELLSRDRKVKEWVLEELTPGLPETLIEEALQYALSDDDDLSCQALAKLAPRLSGALLDQAIAHVSTYKNKRWNAVALAALARQLPHDHEDRGTVLAMAVEAAVSWPLQSQLKGVLADLIPQLLERLRPRAVRAAADEACSDMRRHPQPSSEEFDRLRAVITVLRGPELEQLYARLGEDVQIPRLRARAQAAVIQQASGDHAAGFFADDHVLHRDWPGDLDRAGRWTSQPLRHGGSTGTVAEQTWTKSLRPFSMSPAGGPDPLTCGRLARRPDKGGNHPTSAPLCTANLAADQSQAVAITAAAIPSRCLSEPNSGPRSE
jgi:DNA-binding transcriptional regulator YbjK